MVTILLAMVLATLAGASVATQQVLNANLGTALKSAAWSGFTSYFIGVLCMVLLALALRDPLPSVAAAVRIPWWGWSGGVFGAVFIGLAVILVPQLGAANFFVLLVTGQMLVSVALDHFGWLGLPQRSMDLQRLAGVVLLIGGVVLIRR
jgi:bacterial/archaeal transporter family-2 protein